MRRMVKGRIVSCLSKRLYFVSKRKENELSANSIFVPIPILPLYPEDMRKSRKHDMWTGFDT